MRKKLSVILLSIILLSLVIPYHDISCVVTVGDSFIFNILKSRISVQVNDEISAVKGYRFNDAKYPEKTTINHEFILLSSGSYRTNASINDSKREEFQFKDWFLWRLDDGFMFPAIRHAYSIPYWWHYYNFSVGNYNYTLGFSRFVYPYLQPIRDHWNLIASIEETFTPIFESYNQLGYDIDYAFIYKDENDLVYFESWNGGTVDSDVGCITGEFDDTEASLSYGDQFQVAIDKISGIVKGLHYRGWANGVVKGYNIKVSLDFHYELKGYNLPRFSYGVYSNYVLGNGFLISIASFTFFTIVLIIISKRRKSI